VKQIFEISHFCGKKSLPFFRRVFIHHSLLNQKLFMFEILELLKLAYFKF